MISKEDRYKCQGYMFKVEGLSWLDYKYEINQALKEICGNKFELTDINSKYFFVETLKDNELVPCHINYHNEKVKSDNISLFCKTKFIEKLFKLIPNLNDVKFWADGYKLGDKIKSCQIQDDTRSEFDEVREEKIIELDEQMIKEFGLQNILHHMYGRKYVYIGKVLHTFDKDYIGDYCEYYEKNKIGDKGAIYASGFDKSLYLVYEMDGDKKTIYECEQYFYDLETEKKCLNENKLYNAKHSIGIDGVKYKVYHEDVKYMGQLSGVDNGCSYEIGYCGHGKLYLRNIHEVYEGDFLNNKYDGLGKLVKKEDNEYGEAFSYEGSFSSGKFHGFGTLYDKNHKMIYNGEWSSGKRFGTGTAYNENGSILYRGSWSSDNYDGFGTLFNTDGSVKYSGNWFHGRTEEEQKEYYGMY